MISYLTFHDMSKIFFANIVLGGTHGTSWTEYFVELDKAKHVLSNIILNQICFEKLE